jgi:uncharacterized RDD family membrane protein YckC
MTDGVTADGFRANPYVGLRPFFKDDTLYFFGREQQTAELLEILRQQRFLGVVGSSGSGKSSLVRAGLLPGLLGGFLVKERDRWRTLQVKPGDAPILNLASGLLCAMDLPPTPTAVAELEREIRDGHTDGVLDFLASRLEPNANLFLLVDQFEEIFAFRGIDHEDEVLSEDPVRRKERALRKSEASDFVDLLLALAEQRRLPIYVALTMRTDFLGDCDLFYGLPEALNRGRYLVPRMTREQLRHAVECPALLLGAEVAPRLMDRLLNELGDRFDRLPVLQHALMRTWDEWKAAGGSGAIDLRHFEAAGGLENALNRDAERALEGLDLAVTARVFKRLTDTDLSQRRVRSPARISELMDAAGTDRASVDHIVRRFEEDGRSFVHPSADGKPDNPRVDISHESLIRQWDRLRNWVDEERKARDQYVELASRARKHGQGQAALLEDPELQAAIDWETAVQPSPGWAKRYDRAEGDQPLATRYIDASVDVRCHEQAEAELQRRWKRVWNPLILCSILVAAALVTGDREGVEFKRQRRAQAAQAVQAAQAAKAALMSPDDAPPTAAGPATLADYDALSRADNPVEKSVASALRRLKKFSYLALFVLGYLALAEAGKRVHRSLRYPPILRKIAEQGRRSPRGSTAVEPLVDATEKHQTGYAGTARRLGAFVIDWACFLPIWGVGILVVDAIDPFPPDSAPISDQAAVALLVIWTASAWLYQVLQIASSHQATLGMRATGIFRTDLNGRRLSIARASAWYFARFISYATYTVGFLLQPFTKRKQTLHDLIAKTVVLRRPPVAALLPPGGATQRPGKAGSAGVA